MKQKAYILNGLTASDGRRHHQRDRTDQRAALLKRYQETLPQQEYGKVLRQLREEGILSGRSLANAMVRMTQLQAVSR